MTVEQMEPGLRRVLAPNPSPMTERGTNTYIVGLGRVAVIDPGPDRPQHLEAILGALAPSETVTHILITHAHLDHSALAPALAARTGAPVLAFGGATSGRSEVMRQLARQGLAGGGEGLDHSFAPDIVLADGDRVNGPDWIIEALWTPGHIGGHLSFLWNRAGFSGDHVMGWASSMVSPPDGDLTQFMTSCQRLAERGLRRLYPGHGAPVADPAARIAWLVDHRNAREGQIRAALAQGPGTLPEITARVYTDVPPVLLPAAERNVFAHLIALTDQGHARPSPHLSATATFAAG